MLGGGGVVSARSLALTNGALKGVLVSWERELWPSPDAEALPWDSVLAPDWRKCCVRAGLDHCQLPGPALHCHRMGG